jgi:glycosyltransferase involved in cell wall biosynthesis
VSVDEPLVSVFVPTYNHVAYIDEAIGSAVEQDYGNLQVVVGDDGSTDGTAEKVRAWATRYPQRVVALVGGPHLGITGNCNRALGACRGRYIAFHAGDDVFLPGKVRKQVEWLEADGSRVLCGHAVESFDWESGRTLDVSTRSMKLHTGRGARRLIERFGIFAGVSIMARASAIPPSGCDERIPVVSDFKLHIDILAGGGAYGYVDGVLARSRVHPQSISQRSRHDPEIHRQYFEGFALTLALVESAHPSLAGPCRRARGRLFFSEARWRQQHGEGRAARAYFRAALREDPGRLTAKALAGLLLTLGPEAAQRRFDRLVARYRQT